MLCNYHKCRILGIVCASSTITDGEASSWMGSDYLKICQPLSIANSEGNISGIFFSNSKPMKVMMKGELKSS